MVLLVVHLMSAVVSPPTVSILSDSGDTSGAEVTGQGSDLDSSTESGGLAEIYRILGPGC